MKYEWSCSVLSPRSEARVRPQPKHNTYTTSLLLQKAKLNMGPSFLKKVHILINSTPLTSPTKMDEFLHSHWADRSGD